MFKRLKIVGILAVGGIVAIGGAMYYQANDLKTNYQIVDADITSVEVDCFIKEGKSKVVQKGTDELAYMPCVIAPMIAEKHGFETDDIQKRATVHYSYTSPADQQVHTGYYMRNNDVENLVKGRQIKVHAHKTDPNDSRTSKGNFFIADTGV